MAQMVKNLPAMGSMPGSGRSPGEGHGTPVFLPGESHGQRSLVGCSPWSHKEADVTERLTLSLHFHDSLPWSSSCPGVWVFDSKLPALPKCCSLPTRAQHPPQNKPLSHYGDICGHSQYSDNGSVYCPASDWGIKNVTGDDRREACAGTNEENFQEEGTGWTGPLPERTSLARFLVDSLPTSRGGPRSLKERERWQGSVSEGCLERPHVESQMLPAMLHGLGPLSSSTESGVTSHNYRHLRNVAEWPTRKPVFLLALPHFTSAHYGPTLMRVTDPMKVSPSKEKGLWLCFSGSWWQWWADSSPLLVLSEVCTGGWHPSWHRTSPGMWRNWAGHQFILCQAKEGRGQALPWGRVSQPHSSRGHPRVILQPGILRLQGGHVQRTFH